MLVRSQCQTCCFANLALEVVAGVGGGGRSVCVCWCAVSAKHVVFANLALVVFGGRGGVQVRSQCQTCCFCQLSPCSVWGEGGGVLVRSQCQTCCFANLALVVFGGWGVCWCAVSAKHVVLPT